MHETKTGLPDVLIQSKHEAIARQGYCSKMVHKQNLLKRVTCTFHRLKSSVMSS